MGALLFRSRLLIIAAAFVGALGLALTQRHWSQQQLWWLRPLARLGDAPWALDAVLLGSGLCLLAAFALRLLAEARLRVDVYGQGASHALVEGGPFGWLRNPLYLGTWLFFFAAVVLWAPLLVWLALSAVFFLALDLMVRHEEGLLRQQFGAAYGAYQQGVRRWLPRPPGRGGRAGPVRARAYAWAALGNLGLASLGLFRLSVVLGAPVRLTGAINLACIALWLLVIIKRRVAASRG